MMLGCEQVRSGSLRISLWFNTKWICFIKAISTKTISRRLAGNLIVCGKKWRNRHRRLAGIFYSFLRKQDIAASTYSSILASKNLPEKLAHHYDFHVPDFSRIPLSHSPTNSMSSESHYRNTTSSDQSETPIRKDGMLRNRVPKVRWYEPRDELLLSLF